jgi:hypothetical protein
MEGEEALDVACAGGDEERLAKKPRMHHEAPPPCPPLPNGDSGGHGLGHGHEHEGLYLPQVGVGGASLDFPSFWLGGEVATAGLLEEHDHDDDPR